MRNLEKGVAIAFISIKKQKKFSPNFAEKLCFPSENDLQKVGGAFQPKFFEFLGHNNQELFQISSRGIDLWNPFDDAE